MERINYECIKRTKKIQAIEDKFLKKMEDILYEKYILEKKSAYDIGEEIGISAQNVYYLLKKANIERRHMYFL